MKREIIIVNDFYKDPGAIIRYAHGLQYYNPYANGWRGSSAREDLARAGWHASFFKEAHKCPFKSSRTLTHALERITGEALDMEHWKLGYAEDPQTGARVDPWPYLKDPSAPFKFGNVQEDKVTARWNCAFHFKYHRNRLGEGVHDHLRDAWNGVGEDGWAGLVYLNPHAPREAGLKLMKNKFGNDRERFTSPDRWELVDDLANIYNRLILVRGAYPHQGGPGFGTTHEDGRLFQTFFFKTKKADSLESVNVPL